MREHWTIQYGCTNCDSKEIDVICSEAELPIICAALVRFDEHDRGEKVACVAKKGYGVNFSNYDYSYCDIM